MDREVVGVNERLRFLRYDPGQEFKRHYDGIFRRDDGSEISVITIQIYLKGGSSLVGGGTKLCKNKFVAQDMDVHPEPGRVLLFQHARILYSGEPVIEGRKYTIRSDIMYRL